MCKIKSYMPFLALILLGISKGTTACSDHACVSSGVGANSGLQAHNAYRQQHSIQPLELCSEKLAASASKCAQYYCLGAPSGPNCPYKSAEVGENSLISYFNDNSTVVGPEELTEIASDTWHASGGTDADLLRAFTSKNRLKGVQSFSQMMWSSATRIGFAVCTCEDGRKSIVAHYNEVTSVTEQVNSCTESSGTGEYSTTGSLPVSGN